MVKPVGGRGIKAPYKTTHVRVPIPVKHEVERLIEQFRNQGEHPNKMIIKTITYGFTKNLENYQSQRLGITAELDHTDDWDTVLESLKFLVHNELEIKPAPKAPESTISK
jgi:hypothetical protein